MSLSVYKALSVKYSDQRYVLKNSYVFDWESDFFFMTPSKLFVEVEVKVSKADFKKDFTKVDKHNTLSRTFNSEKYILTRGNTVYSYEYDEEEYIRPRVYDETTGRPLKKSTGRRLKSTISLSESKLINYLSNFKNATFEENSCEIRIKPLPLSPNKFYYACPKGLINIKDVPKYAGLIWVVDGVAKIVKKAPSIHKDKLNLDKVLLEKFYWKSINLQNRYERRI